MGLRADVEGLEPGGRVTLYELDATAIGGELYRFHGYAQSGPIWWKGAEYSPWPITAEGFEMDGTGGSPVPRLSVGDHGGFVTALCLYLDDLAGARLTRRQTLARYLDAQNFPEGNPEANPDEEFPESVWQIECKADQQPGELVAFELSSALDFEGVKLPRRQVVANVCGWLAIGGYRGANCGYTGPPVADEYDVITTDAARDRCGGRVRSCKLRHGENAELPYGSFPAAGLIRN